MNCDFSLKHYQFTLNTALDSGYRFYQYDKLPVTNDYVCVLRHDIDYTPERSLEFAEIEMQLDIKAYYFFLVSSEIYNIRNSQIHKILHLLKNMGHNVGLHFDLSWNPEVEWENVVHQCNKEKEIFEVLTDISPCNIISFHNPHKFTELVLNKSIAGITHTYEQRYFSDTKYLSDSQGWYEGCMCKIFQEKKYRKIQLLTHPYIWTSEPKADFIADMAQMLQDKTKNLTDHLINAHPVCLQHKEKLRRMTAFK
ncbi:MAG: hypothetical protein ACYSR1_05060 [Planctomycetota bacterium]|jgi:hypothetical protein